MSRILVASGGGEYTDPWHPFAVTTACLERALTALGHEVTVTTEITRHLSPLGLDGEAAWQLVVLNLGSAATALPTDAANAAGLLRFSAAGGPLLVCHVSSTAFPAVAEWEPLLGGRWVRGETMHPPQGPGAIHVLDAGHPVTEGVSDFTLVDERYSYLRVAPDSTVLATQQHDGIDHAVLWARESGPSRVVYDALGHDAPSFDSDEHQRIIANSVGWLLG